VFVSAATKDIQLSNVDESLAETSDFSSQFLDRETYIRTETVSSNSPQSAISPGTTQRIRSRIAVDPITIPDFKNSKYAGKHVQKFFNKLPGGSPDKTLDFNIMDYIEVGREVSSASDDSSNYFMHLLKNNKYTPELVCCMINYILKGFDNLKGEPNIKAALEFLRSMKAVLQPVQFDYGKVFEDVFNRLFGDVKSKLLGYAISELTKFIEKQKEKLITWMDKVIDDDLFTRFCTPLIDMVGALTQALDHLRQVIEVFLKDLADWLLSFELKMNSSMISFSHANRNSLLNDLLGSLIAALETGKLCNYNAATVGDIHPDAGDIINDNSKLPDTRLSKSVNDYNALVQDVMEAVGSDDIGVGEFQDPTEPEVTGPISIYRTNDGLSVIETIVKYSGNCNSIDEEDPQRMTLGDLDT
jgi:hypothetical protein